MRTTSGGVEFWLGSGSMGEKNNSKKKLVTPSVGIWLVRTVRVGPNHTYIRIHGTCTVLLAGEIYTRSYTVYINGSGYSYLMYAETQLSLGKIKNFTLPSFISTTNQHGLCGKEVVVAARQLESRKSEH